jgi:hypothetical protein
LTIYLEFLGGFEKMSEIQYGSGGHIGLSTNKMVKNIFSNSNNSSTTGIWA